MIDSDGRCVDRRETKRSANGVAYVLNQAAREGRLASALKAA